MRHHQSIRGRRSRAGDGERGAVLVELAIVSVFLITLIAGSFDYGMAWRSGLAVNEAARTGARVGSAAGRLDTADFNILSGIRSVLASGKMLANVERVVIYRSTEVGGAPPATCTTTTTTTADPCVIVTGDQLRAMATTVGAGALGSSTSILDAKGCLKTAMVKKWCPKDRNEVQLDADYLGVYVQVRHNYEFRLLGSSTKIGRDAVMRLEPKES